MATPPDLDEELHFKVLAFVTEPRASATCLAWKALLYKTLHLENRARFNLRLHSDGKALFTYGAVRPLAEDFEESVTFNFDFAPNGTYRMQWTRIFDAWSSQTEQHFGAWRIVLDQVVCETLDPGEAVSEREVRFAPPGYKFQVPVADILNANGAYFTAPPGALAASWELPARTGKQEDGANTISHWQELEEVVPAAVEAFRAPLHPDARFVEIDGAMHEVSADIVTNWPENDWARLMRIRLRFGING